MVQMLNPCRYMNKEALQLARRRGAFILDMGPYEL